MDQELAHDRGWAATPRRSALLGLVVLSLASAPVSWVMDGVTPSFIVYPLVLLLGLWRQSMPRHGATR